MKLTCNNLKKSLAHVIESKECSILTNGVLRYTTFMKYPDGSFVDVYVTLIDDMGGQHLKVSDAGYTSDLLFTSGIDFKPNHKKYYYDLVGSTHGVRFFNSEIYKVVNDSTLLGSAVIDVAQASVKISNLMLNSRIRSKPSFQLEFEDFLVEELNLGHRLRKNVSFDVGSSQVIVPYSVEKAHSPYLLQTLSCSTASEAKTKESTIFTNWTKLQTFLQKDKNDFITILNSDDETGHLVSKDLLSINSRILTFPEMKDDIGEMLERAS